jgi:PAS domain S-box-containing protein
LKGVVATRLELFKTTSKTEHYIDELEQTCKDGTTVWVEMNSYFRLNPYNKRIELFGTSRNINKRKAFEKRTLQDQKDKERINRNYQQLINDLHEGLGIVDLNENFIFVNPALQEMLGFTSDELVGKNLSEFIPSADFQQIKDETVNRKLGQASNYVSKLITKTGITKAISISASPWRDENGEVMGALALITDVTNQLKASEELKRRYNFEKHIFNISSRFSDGKNFTQKVEDSLIDIAKLSGASSVFVVIFDYKNDACKIDYRWSNKNEECKHPFELYPISDFTLGINQLKSEEHFYLKNLEERKNEQDVFIKHLIKNKISSFMGFPIYLGANLYGFLGAINILLESFWSPNEFILLRSAGEILCNSIQRKLNEDQINNLNLQLNEKNKEVESVLYVTSHDIRSPLVNIIGFTKELNKSIDELNEYLGKEHISEEDKENINYLIHEDIPEVLKFINAGGHKIDKLLNSLLRLSRMGRTPLELSMVNSLTIVNEIIESMEYQIQTFNINVTVGLLPEFITDKNLFTQIMTNLIDNAIKYHDENKQSSISIESEFNEKENIFTVTDNGIGIAAVKQEAVFEIFNRINPDHTDGEGIGLTILKRAVERLNGKISLESEIGKGCCFTITLNKN